jgi:hypothetical protein
MTRRDELTVDDIKAAANARMFDVLAWCGIRERPDRAGTILMSAPMRKDVHPSFAIWTKGGFVAFKDLAGGPRGDIIDLVAYCNGWWERPKRGSTEAIRFLKDKLGLERIDAAELERDRAASQKRNAELRKEANEKAARSEGAARSLWIQAPQIWGHRAAERYVKETRGLNFDLLPKGPRGGDRRPEILHFLPNEKHIWQGDKTDAKNGQESFWPCIVAPCVDFSGEDKTGVIRAIHRCWIKRDGSDKAPVIPARKCWPAMAGTVIPLWRGDSGLSVREAIKNGLRETLVLCEGWEDGFSAVLGAPQFRTWAMISLSNMANIAPAIGEWCDGIIVHRQNDWNKPQAVEQFNRGKAALEALGIPVAEMLATGGKDINDTLRGGK